MLVHTSCTLYVMVVFVKYSVAKKVNIFTMPKMSNDNIILICLSLVGISLCAEYIIEALKRHAKPNSITM